MKRFKKFRDDRFALTTLQNPLCDPRNQAELELAIQQERQRHPQPSTIPATPSSSTPNPPAAPAAANPSPAPDPHAAAPASPNSQNETAQQPEQQEESYEYAMIVPVARPPRKPRKIAKSRRKRRKRLKSDDLSALASRLSGYMERAEKLGLLGSQSPATLAVQPVAPAIATPAPPPAPAPAPAEDPEEEYDEELDEDLSEAELAQLSVLDRHSRKCSVCHHPRRQEIEEYFVEWHSPTTIADCFGVKSFTSLYHHAHALGLFELRARNLRGALANMIEDSDRTEATPKEVIQAVRAYAHINAQGEWTQPVNKSEARTENRTEVVFSGKRSPVFSNGQEILIANDKLLENDATH